MSDTRPITDSFPWFAVRYRPVFNNTNVPSGGITGQVFLVSDSGAFLTSDSGTFLTTGATVFQGNLGDLYRYV